MTNRQAIEIIWFKRDLRCEDHLPLTQACQSAKTFNRQILPIYVIEPSIWQGEDTSPRHWQFIYASLLELDTALANMGQRLQVLVGEVIEHFETLAQHFHIETIWSHQETGNAISYQRDIKVQHFCRDHQISWHEFPQHAVLRGSANRDHYHQQVKQFFAKTVLPSPDFHQTIPVTLTQASVLKDLAKNPFVSASEGFNPQIQTGGRSQGVALLKSFLNHRHQHYLKCLAKPLGGDLFSSRLSAHLAYGTLSSREVLEQLHSAEPLSSNRKTLQACSQRLMWQSHFMQKLESEPDIEFQSMHSAYANLRAWTSLAQCHFKAWSEGQTGYPMIDACMRCLLKTGWLPFRMRALVVSFASYQLWIPWQKTAIFLAKQFTDYEPGIHYSQVQMQSGTTGINAIRIYNPIKQSQDHDPNGAFIRRWCPELKLLSSREIHTPWERDLLSTETTLTYPDPIVDLQTSTQLAKERIYAVKKAADHQQESQEVFIKHGSRRKTRHSNKKPNNTHKQRSASQAKIQAHANQMASSQLSLF